MASSREKEKIEHDSECCMTCDLPLSTEMDLVLLEVVDVGRNGVCEVVKNVSEGYYFLPYFHHADCWSESARVDISNANADSPPLASSKPRLVHCESCLRVFDDEERAIQCTSGSLQQSKLRTDLTFVREAKPSLLCLTCFAPISNNHPDWEEELFDLQSS